MWPIPWPCLFSGLENNAVCRMRGAEIDPEIRQALESAGWLSYAGVGTWMSCSDCADGGCPVMALGEEPDGTAVYQVLCQQGDILMPTEGELTEWEYTPAVVADALARVLGAAPRATPVIPQRLWALGETTFAGASVNWFLGIGTTRPDALAVFGGAPALQSARLAVVLTPTDVPAMEGVPAHVVTWPFSTLLRVAHGEIRFVPEALEALAREVVSRDTQPRSITAKARKWLDVPAGTTWEQVIITVANTDALTIQAPGTPQGETFTYDELGFWDDRTSDPAADMFTPDALWRRFLRFAALYLPDEQVSRAAWAGTEAKQQAHVKTWAYQINQRLNAVVRGITPKPLPIVGNRGCYRAAFMLVLGARFLAEMQGR